MITGDKLNIFEDFEIDRSLSKFVEKRKAIKVKYSQHQKNGELSLVDEEDAFDDDSDGDSIMNPWGNIAAPAGGAS